MSYLSFLLQAIFAMMASFLSVAPAGAAETPAPVAPLNRAEAIARSAALTPSPRQLVWQQREQIAFVHFGVNTFTNREWGEGTESPSIFNPTELDAKQWMKVLTDAGIKQVILTAKHHDGFCLWPSKYTDHSVKSSPWRDGKGDVVREVSDAAREAGIAFGVYCSPWDRHEKKYGGPEYNQYFMNQLRELLTNYGEIAEVWLDGACGEGPNGKKQVYDFPAFIALIRELQPKAVIFSDAGPDVRWVGNEKGFAGETNWSTLRRDEFYPGTPNSQELPFGQIDGTHWLPAEADVSIRPGWFHHPEEAPKTPEQLLDIYYKSVGRNAVFLLNFPPDTRGLIPDNDAQSARELAQKVAQIFAKDLALGSQATASSIRDNNDGVFAATNTVDGKDDTTWAADDGDTSPVLEFTLPLRATFNHAMLMENILVGQHVSAFALDAWQDGAWKQFAEGTTIGYKRILVFPQVTTNKVRVRFLDGRSYATLSRLGLFMN